MACGLSFSLLCAALLPPAPCFSCWGLSPCCALCFSLQPLASAVGVFLLVVFSVSPSSPLPLLLGSVSNSKPWLQQPSGLRCLSPFFVRVVPNTITTPSPTPKPPALGYNSLITFACHNTTGLHTLQPQRARTQKKREKREGRREKREESRREERRGERGKQRNKPQ